MKNNRYRTDLEPASSPDNRHPKTYPDMRTFFISTFRCITMTEGDTSPGQPGTPPLGRREFIVGGSIAGVAGCTRDRAGEDQSDGDPSPGDSSEPLALLLTWQRDPTSTMTIDWHSKQDEVVDPTLSSREAGTEEWEDVSADTNPFDLFERDIHRVELDGLESATTYEFRVDDSRVYTFRTLPGQLDREITFAVGGDADHDPPEQSNWARVAEQVMDYDLDFFIIGGDLAYADGGTAGNHRSRWRNWFDVVNSRLIDDDGRVIPLVAAIGNHECKDFYYFAADEYEDSDEWRTSFAPYFYNLFAFPGLPGYAVLDVGDYLSIPLLDSDHTNPVQAQTNWLEEVLSERTDVDHVLPTYHVPAWPSNRSFDGRTERAVRGQWVPLFEAYGVRMAFEHHDHALNISYPIRDGEIDPTGVVYVGDGPLGHSEREPSLDRWYLNRTKNRFNADVVTITPNEIAVRAIDDRGHVLHELGRAGPEYDITHYPHIGLDRLSEYFLAGWDVELQTTIANSSPVVMNEIDVHLEGVEEDFGFERDDEVQVDELASGEQIQLRWIGEAPDVSDDVEIQTVISFTVDGEPREETRTDWLPIGY